MICGDDISRIPETSKPDFECNKESTQDEQVEETVESSEEQPEESVEEQAEEVSESIGKITNRTRLTALLWLYNYN